MKSINMFTIIPHGVKNFLCLFLLFGYDLKFSVVMGSDSRHDHSVIAESLTQSLVKTRFIQEKSKSSESSNHKAHAPRNALSEPRTALVIGNADYIEAPLNNPVHDAHDMAQVLSTLGFSVVLKKNADNKEMRNAVRKLGESLRNGGIGLFYFSGHGLQSKNRNFLIPINADIQNEADVEFEALDADYVLQQMEEANNGVNIVILDACRSNPFTRKFRSGLRGLARVDSLRGSLIAYATAPGSVAEDGEGRNGTYTKHLLTGLRTMSSRSITDLFTEVGAKVQEETEGEQIPWQSISLSQNFCFRPCGDDSGRDPPSTIPTPEVPGKYPEASTRALTPDDLKQINPVDLKIMRNEIFARHGYIFGTSEMLQNYFNQQAWYEPKYKDVSNFLTFLEKANIDLIRTYENAQSKKPSENNVSAQNKESEAKKESSDIEQLIKLSLQAGGMGHENEILSIINELEKRPQPTHGDRKTARKNNEQGLEALRQTQISQAIQFFLTGFQADPADSELLNNLGYAYLLDKNPLAKDYLLKVLYLSPKRAGAWANLGHWYIQVENKLNEAIASFALAYRFSTHRSRTIKFFQDAANKEPSIKQAIEKTLDLEWIRTDLMKLDGLEILIPYPTYLPKGLNLDQIDIKGDEKPNYSIKFGDQKTQWFKLESDGKGEDEGEECEEHQTKISSQLFGFHDETFCLYPDGLIISEWIPDETMANWEEETEKDEEAPIKGRYHHVISQGLSVKEVIKIIESLQDYSEVLKPNLTSELK